MTPENTLSIYGSHDAGAVYIDSNGNIKVLEYERFVKKRYAMFSSDQDHREGLGSNDQERRDFLIYIINDTRDRLLEHVVYNELGEKDKELISEYFPGCEFHKKEHHESHAASGFFTSNFKKSLILSIDGGGVDNGDVGYTRSYIGEGNTVSLLENLPIDFGGAYGQIGCPISEINPGPDSNQISLSYAGKVMGICAYGKSRSDWVYPMIRYYTWAYQNLEATDEATVLKVLGNDISLDLSFNTLSGQNSYDLAATSQECFEAGMFTIVKKYLNIENIDSIILVGGCALNVLFNQKLYEWLKINKPGIELYVPATPSDCGLALGQFLHQFPSVAKGKSLTYNGFEVLDGACWDQMVDTYKATKTSVSEIVDLLKQGKIIGLMEGQSEVGPRALGNRSIICDPSFPDMKDILNSKVKFREWFRPFAPVCRLEDKDIYFENACESEFMSYAPKVKAEFREKLKSVTHADNTSRLQTVTRAQHERFYNILEELSSRGEVPVILNTSFNIKGKPILTTIEDALHVLDNTKLDYVVIQGYIFKKI